VRRLLRILAVSVVLLISAGFGGLPARAAAPAPPPLPAATAMLLVDIGTGREIFGSHEHVMLRPASLTKLLTATIATDWLPPTTLVRVSPRAAAVAPDKVGMKAGQRWRLTIALHALLISSSNDAAYALAEQVAGSVPRFATLMAAAAAQLGMTDHLVLQDPAGLDGTEGAGGGNLMSAWDVAIAARALMANPNLAAIVRLTTYRFTGPDGIVYELASHNRAFLNSYPGAIGIKTGYTGPAGVCVAEEAVRGGRAMLAVVMNGVSPDQTAAMLLDKGFATPAQAETRKPLLPAVREPTPVRAVPVRARPEEVLHATAPPPPSAEAQAGPKALPARHHEPAAVVAVLGGAVILGLGAGLATRWRVRRRSGDGAGV
jgi:D-alanyl-D-alanine carboxypeptidase